MPALSESLVFIPAESVGSTATTAVVYPNTSTSVLVYFSDQHKGNGYFGAGDGLHTVMYVTDMNFQGTITMQASLATAPGDNDWFDIDNTAVRYTYLDERTTSSTDVFNFVGNFVWVRGSVSINNGSVLYIQYNH